MMNQTKNLFFVVIIAIVMLFSGIFMLTGFNPLQLFSSSSITVKQLNAMLEEDYQFVDIRTLGEYNAGHIDEFNINLDFYQFQNNLSMLNGLDKEKTTVIICNSGNRTTTAYKLMKDYGFKTVYHVRGGMQEWWRVYG